MSKILTSRPTRDVFLLLCLSLSACESSPRSATVPAATGQTDRPLDLSIAGDGFFIVQTPAGGYLFTRRGALSVSSTGELVNDDGYKLYPVIDVTAASEKVTVTPRGVVEEKPADGPPTTAGQILLVRFPHAAALDRDGVYCMPTATSGDPITGIPGTKGLGTVVAGRIAE